MAAPRAVLSPRLHRARRQRLVAEVGAPVLLVGNGRQARNSVQNPYPFRQDSTFLHFTGCDLPDAALLLAPGREVLYLPEPDPSDALWHGEVPDFGTLREAFGVEEVRSTSTLESDVAALEVLCQAVSDPARSALASRLGGRPLAYADHDGHPALLDAIIRQRLVKDPEDVVAHRATAAVTAKAHAAAMAITRPGATEAAVAALFDAVLAAWRCVPAYTSIVTVRGEVLHNHDRPGVLRDGDLLLLDGGAEGPTGHATDVTRTWPVSGRFTARQLAVYEAVLEAQRVAIACCVPGVRYRDVHLAAATVLARFLVDEGLLVGDVEALVADGAHAVFFPHGIGHLLGLDVHDLEPFGDRAQYAPGRTRSSQFGLAWLRLDRDLEPGMLVTIEPGFYVVPAILRDPQLRATFGDRVAWDRAAQWVGFGGIRIEDDVLVTGGLPEVLTVAIPKDPQAVEGAVGVGVEVEGLLG